MPPTTGGGGLNTRSVDPSLSSVEWPLGTVTRGFRRSSSAYYYSPLEDYDSVLKRLLTFIEMQYSASSRLGEEEEEEKSIGCN